MIAFWPIFIFWPQEYPNLPMLARTPIIPGVNDNVDAIMAIAEMIRPYEQVRYELLPYHRLGTQKYYFFASRSANG